MYFYSNTQEQNLIPQTPKKHICVRAIGRMPILILSTLIDASIIYLLLPYIEFFKNYPMLLNFYTILTSMSKNIIVQYDLNKKRFWNSENCLVGMALSSLLFILTILISSILYTIPTKIYKPNDYEAIIFGVTIALSQLLLGVVATCIAITVPCCFNKCNCSRLCLNGPFSLTLMNLFNPVILLGMAYILLHNVSNKCPDKGWVNCINNYCIGNNTFNYSLYMKDCFYTCNDMCFN